MSKYIQEVHMDNKIAWVLLAIIGSFFLILGLVAFGLWLNEFNQALKYINNEIRRTEGREREHWKRERRRLWLSLIPFYRQ